jgi:hypothetical protein
MELVRLCLELYNGIVIYYYGSYLYNISMSIYIDRKYTLLISSRLRNFKQKKDSLFNFSCPFCGDSQKNKLKARGYIYQSKNFTGYAFQCHNCGVGMGLGNFLKQVDSERYKDYTMENFTEKSVRSSEVPIQKNETKPQQNMLVVIPKICHLPELHPARQYILGRKIPEQFWNEIYYAEDFKQFVDEFCPGHEKDLIENDPRIVLFHTGFAGDIKNISGRSLVSGNQTRYIKVQVEEGDKAFGLHRINPRETVYIVEGEFDSMFLPNGVAAGHGQLGDLANLIYDILGAHCVVVSDNEPRNKQIVQSIKKAITDGDSVCIWPESFKYKDVNEAILGGMTIAEIRSIIDDNTCEGLEALFLLNAWKKC